MNKISIITLLNGIKEKEAPSPETDSMIYMTYLRYWTLRGNKWSNRKAWAQSSISGEVVENIDKKFLEELINTERIQRSQSLFEILNKQSKYYKAFSLVRP